MNFEVVFNPDGSVSIPDLPQALFPVVRELGASIPPRTQSSVDLSCQAAYLDTKATLTTFHTADLPGLTRDELWAVHDQALVEIWSSSRSRYGSDRIKNPDRKLASLFDLKLELVKRSLKSCDLCAFNCAVDRWRGEKGRCGSTQEATLGRNFLDWGEEAHLIPTISTTLNGCNWDCVYCQYPQHLDRGAGELIIPETLAERIDQLAEEGANSIQWVGGNPDQHIWTVLRTLKTLKAKLPITWNSNGYASKTALRILEGVVDVYLLDFRHWAEGCAKRYGVPEDSRMVLQANLRTLAAQKSDLIVRHLQLPGHFECCTRPILRWLAEVLPGVKLNLLHGQYRPAHQAYRYPEINRRLTPAERVKTETLATKLGLYLVE